MELKSMSIFPQILTSCFKQLGFDFSQRKHRQLFDVRNVMCVVSTLSTTLSLCLKIKHINVWLWKPQQQIIEMLVSKFRSTADVSINQQNI